MLLGTAFPVTRKHVVTAFHNVMDDKANARLSDTFVIGKRVERNNGIHEMENPIEVTVDWGDPVEDFVFLQIVNAANYVNDYLPLCPEPLLPNPYENERVEVKTYHAPIGQYLSNEISYLAIWSDDYKRVLQVHISGRRIIVDGGLYRGSCGGPYINYEGLVVAMHITSMHEGKNISDSKGRKRKMKDRVEDLESLSASVYDLHQLVREEIVLSRIPDAVDFIRNVIASTV